MRPGMHSAVRSFSAADGQGPVWLMCPRSLACLRERERGCSICHRCYHCDCYYSCERGVGRTVFRSRIVVVAPSTCSPTLAFAFFFFSLSLFPCCALPLLVCTDFEAGPLLVGSKRVVGPFRLSIEQEDEMRIAFVVESPLEIGLGHGRQK